MKRIYKHWDTFVLSVCVFVVCLCGCCRPARQQQPGRGRTDTALIFPCRCWRECNAISPLMKSHWPWSRTHMHVLTHTHTHTHEFTEDSRSLYIRAASFDHLIFSININFVPFEPSFVVAMILFIESLWRRFGQKQSCINTSYMIHRGNKLLA